jgi:hypothetical protein
MTGLYPQQDHKASRRDFIKAATVAAGATAVACLPATKAFASEDIGQLEKGGPTYYMTQDSSADPMAPVSGIADWDYEADVVIVGGGGAGLSALVTSAEQGLSAILVEKNAFVGGDTSIAMVFSGNTGSRFQRSCGVAALSTEERFWTEVNTALTPSVQFGRNATLVRLILDAQAATCDWLEENGVVFSTQAAGGLPPGRTSVPIDPAHPEEDWYYWWPHNARGFTEALAQSAQSHDNATILTEHPAYALVQQDGAVIGVACRDFRGADVFVKGKRVILCAGGFTANRDMLDKYYYGDADLVVRPWGMPSAMGEGIRIAQGVGAAVSNMHELELWDGGALRELGAHGIYNAVNQLVRQKSLTVNKLAKRFFCESRYAGYQYTYQAAMNCQQPDATSFTLFDAGCIEREDILKKFKPTLCEYPVPWFDAQFKEGLASGTIMKAGSLAELAGLMGVDAAQLAQTVERYNLLCEKGHDDDFFKEPDYMVPILDAPFYAVKQTGASAFNTWGGLVADEAFHVVGVDGKPIPELFVAGENACGLASVAYAITGGRLAAKSASSEISADK